jgi:hypothetical protein
MTAGIEVVDDAKEHRDRITLCPAPLYLVQGV